MSSSTYGRHRDKIGATVEARLDLENDPDNQHVDCPILEDTHVHTIVSSNQDPQIETAPPMKANYGTGGESGGL
jgi:recombination DNA repair RAD52 pathway protein